MATSYVGKRVNSQLVPVRRSALHIPLPLLIVGWIIKWTVLGLWAMVRSPAALFGLVLVAQGAVGHHLAGSQFGFVVVVTTYVWLFFACLLVYLKVTPVQRYVQSRVRRFWTYQHKWPATMDFAELAKTRKNGNAYMPVLGKVRSTATVDRVQARMLAGQTVDDWAKKADRLSQTFGAIDCRVSAIPKRPHDVLLTFLLSDPLDRIIQPCYATNDLSALPVALREDGDWYKLRLLGTHVLLVGATGAGKSSVIWSVMNQVKSNVSDGTAQIWALDPKGGMELAFGRSLFARFEHGALEDFAATLEDAVFLMSERKAALMGKVRLHTPSKAEPLILIVIDELASLTAYVNDNKMRARLANALNLLLSQGRAVGITVLAAIQDPLKETLPNRGLFPPACSCGSQSPTRWTW
jgi:DNA segregation ATPase FtsK/SpoIIIE, S-DNA-T family